MVLTMICKGIVLTACLFLIQSGSCNFVPYKEDLNSCHTHEFKCKNGQCINDELLCDGKADCKDESDETSNECSIVTCPKFTFACDYGACIHREYKCNGIKNCLDNSDERGCTKYNKIIIKDRPISSTHASLKVTKYICKSDDFIDEELICDGEADCPDHSDETLSLCFNFHCPYFTFRCGYGACISLNKKCNGVNDCVDGSDEKTCLGPTTSKPYIQTTTTLKAVRKTFTCSSGEIIDEEFLCDGEADCADQSDETYKECFQYHCPGYTFKCDYGACVPYGAKCNGIKECADNSDETSCSMDFKTVSVLIEKFKCTSGQTIDADMVCDGRADCTDSSDETLHTCSKINCPRFTYRCNYGACVHGTSRCNGIIECVDNSDETLCAMRNTSITKDKEQHKDQLIFS